MNVFYRVPPDPEQLKQMEEQFKMQMEQMDKEMAVGMKEKLLKLQQAVESGEILPERMQLEAEKLQKEVEQQKQQAVMQFQQAQQEMQEVIENQVVSEKEFKILMENEDFEKNLVDAIKFHDVRIKQTCVIGDKTIYEYVFPPTITDYPLIPLHYKWTGTPFPMSAVAPLVGKQREINKAHQIMVHNASLGSSLRWMYEEGSIDTDYWEKYSSST